MGLLSTTDFFGPMREPRNACLAGGPRCVFHQGAGGEDGGQVKMKRVGSPCERRSFFSINVEFMRGGVGSGQRFVGRR